MESLDFEEYCAALFWNLARDTTRFSATSLDRSEFTSDEPEEVCSDSDVDGTCLLQLSAKRASSLLHAVTRMTSGVRYSLIVFLSV